LYPSIAIKKGYTHCFWCRDFGRHDFGRHEFQAVKQKLNMTVSVIEILTKVPAYGQTYYCNHSTGFPAAQRAKLFVAVFKPSIRE
jgi:hypothetical protein